LSGGLTWYHRVAVAQLCLLVQTVLSVKRTLQPQYMRNGQQTTDRNV